MGRVRNRLVLIALLAAGIVLPAGSQARTKPRQSGDPPRDGMLAQIAQGKTFGVRRAPIKIEDFTDFECPACRALYMKTLSPLIQQYVSSGKVYLVHHDFPLPMHRFSHQAAYYADAAAAIGRFGPVENALFTNQPKWAVNGKIEPFLAAVLTPAELRKVDELARTKEIHEAVQRDFALGTRLGVHETPTIFITYKGKRTPVIGAVSFPILERYLDALLHP
ncbi:MAG TPA: thioredoxin domain-containing protein [Patescibacteria group bacterium]|nr:thioredoxin domain-containing protein [Patescibacteria group bacterium]